MRETAANSEPLYIEAEPRPGLKGIVRRIWRFEGPGDASKIERIPPDGCAELIIHLGSPYQEIDGDGGRRTQPAIFFAGQLTRPLAIASPSRVSTLGVRFEPDGARAFFGAPMQEATDQRIDLARIHGADATALYHSVASATDWPARFAIAERYVERRIATANVSDDAVITAAVAMLEQENPGDVPGGLSERQFQRRFLDRVGVPARMLQSIFRFRRVFNAIEHPDDPDWVAAALAAGYFDQPQMARDFRRFLGCTASDWARQKVGLAALLASESYKP